MLSRDHAGKGFIDGAYGHDIGIAECLRILIHWNYIEVVLSRRIIRKGFWRSPVTRFLQQKLGPNLSRRREVLVFRPRYFTKLISISGKTKPQIGNFMLGRESFSWNPRDDLDELNETQSEGANEAIAAVEEASQDDDVMSVRAENAIKAVEEFELTDTLRLSEIFGSQSSAVSATTAAQEHTTAHETGSESEAQNTWSDEEAQETTSSRHSQETRSDIDLESEADYVYEESRTSHRYTMFDNDAASDTASDTEAIQPYASDAEIETWDQHAKYK